ncbi:transcriptional regulator [Pseudomonas mandelii]|uniref:transcriptional regulator n=1 Tax=Pseudomonas mandelii TaxID=75612 RepID=UPI00037942AE|nr:transcriptional regulator [Pseudomonas mandelii]
MSLKEALAAVVRGVRLGRGLTQEDLSVVDRSYLTRIEGGKINITVEILQRIAELLKVDAGLLLSLAASLQADGSLDSTSSRLIVQMHELKHSGIFESIVTTLATPRAASGRGLRADTSEKAAAANKLREAGVSLSEIAKKLQLSKTTAHRYLKKADKLR